MSFLGGVTNFTTGMAIAFPAITITDMLSAENPNALNMNEFSWFGKKLKVYYSIKFILL